jgi:hypothetical protein
MTLILLTNRQQILHQLHQILQIGKKIEKKCPNLSISQILRFSHLNLAGLEVFENRGELRMFGRVQSSDMVFRLIAFLENLKMQKCSLAPKGHLSIFWHRYGKIYRTAWILWL